MARGGIREILAGGRRDRSSSTPSTHSALPVRLFVTKVRHVKTRHLSAVKLEGGYKPGSKVPRPAPSPPSTLKLIRDLVSLRRLPTTTSVPWKSYPLPLHHRLPPPADLASELAQYDAMEPVSTPSTTTADAASLPEQPRPTRSCLSWGLIYRGQGSPLDRVKADPPTLLVFGGGVGTVVFRALPKPRKPTRDFPGAAQSSAYRGRPFPKFNPPARHRLYPPFIAFEFLCIPHPETLHHPPIHNGQRVGKDISSLATHTVLFCTYLTVNEERS
jgi:hypothetical protein